MDKRLRLSLFSLLLSLGFVTEFVTASPAPQTPSAPKSFAVFTTSYNTGNDLVRGGVNGTVFFISSTRAVTANHVLNPASFRPLPGFERVKVWLVHEGYTPIEIKSENVRSNSAHDLTVVNLPSAEKVPDRFVFKVGKITALKTGVTSEGFVANTAGPILIRQGQDVIVHSVPYLERLFMQGEVIRATNVDLKALDIDLKNSPSVQLSYQPIVGISGGPVVSTDGQVIAMNSFADPGTFKQTWALQLQPGLQPLATP